MADTPGEEEHGSDDPEDEDIAVTEARIDEATSIHVPPRVMRLIEGQIPDITHLVTTRVQNEIPEYAGSAAGRRRKLIAMAISESSTLFVRRLGGRAASTAGVDNLFRQMGYGEGHEGRTLEALERALRIAGREAWKGLLQAVVTAGLPASVLGHLADELTIFLDRLAEQAHVGHAMASRQLDRDVTGNRDQLLAALLSGAEPAVIRRHAELAGWPVPESVVLVAGCCEEPVSWPDNDDLEGHTLSRVDEHPDDLGSTALFLTSPEHVDDLVGQLTALGDGVRLAYSWPMPLTDARDAERWVIRALELVAKQALPRRQVTDCSQFRTQLWLHAEPTMRRQLAQELLKPLFAEPPNSREILSETLLVWLETRGSGPVMAAILGVHVQTVRYRWRRIHELFGEQLQDPEFVVQLTMVLKASVPLWLAGDQSDFERYKTGESQ